MKRRTADLPLHGGRAPRWLFERMTELAGAITMAVAEEYGPSEMLRRLADPWWFQAFGCVLGFDWHSSGLTTVTCGAMKEAARRYGDDLGVAVAGGKGAASRRAPREIADGADRWALSEGDRLVYASRMSAKVDSGAVQDGHQVYHHSFFFSTAGDWCVVQQGMDEAAGRARRYHWHGDSVSDFVCEPHAGIRDLQGGMGPDSVGPADPAQRILDLSARESKENRRVCADLTGQDPDRIAREALRLTEGPTLFAPDRHAVAEADVNPSHLRRVMRSLHEDGPEDFESLLGAEGVGPAAVRSLSLIAEIVHGVPASHRDPAHRFGGGGGDEPPGDEGSPHGEEPPAGEAAPDGRGRKWADYSYAHGGKDGHPYPVNRSTYDRSIQVLRDAVRRARMGDRRKSEALKRLAGYEEAARPD